MLERTVKYGELVSLLEDNSNFKYSRDIVHLFLAGSYLHGARTEDSDLDYLGYYIEPPIVALGIRQEKGIVTSTADQYEKNTKEDSDTTLKTLREFARLASKGNPTVIAGLFVPNNLSDPSLHNTVWQDIIANRRLFLARTHINAFLGYGDSQFRRLKGVKGRGTHGQRPELEEKFGYDTKAGMHLIRMMYEGSELVTTGHLTFPRPEVDLLLSIRNGQLSLSSIESMYFRLETKMKEEVSNSPLPEQTDKEAISKLISNAYIKHWIDNGYIDTTKGK